MKHGKKFEGGFTRRGIMIVLALVAIVIVGVVFFVSRGATPDKQKANINLTDYRAVGDGFIKAMSEKDGATSYNLLSGTGKTAIGSQSDWQKSLNTSFGKSTGNPTFVSVLDIKNSTGGTDKDRQPKLVTYRFQLYNSKWETSLTITKNKNIWKIDNVITNLR